MVVIAPGKRPASIPNLEAKPGSANGTATARLWESRTPPQHTSSRGTDRDSVPSLSFHTHTTNQLTHQSPIMAGDLRPQPSQQRHPQSDTMRTLHRCWLPTRATTASSSNAASLASTSPMPPGMVGSTLGPANEHRSSIHAPHDPQVACNSDDRTFRGTPTNVAIPTTPFQTLETRLGELHATFPGYRRKRGALDGVSWV